MLSCSLRLRPQPLPGGQHAAKTAAAGWLHGGTQAGRRCHPPAFCAAVTTPPHAPPSSIKRYDLSAPKSLWIPSMHIPRPPPRARRMSLPSSCFPAPSLSPLLLLLLAPQPAPPIAPVHCCQTVCNPRQPPLPCSFLFPCPCVFRSCTWEPSLPDDACSPSRMLLAPLLPMQWLALFKILKPEMMQGCRQVSTRLCQDRWQAFVRGGGGSWVWRPQWLRQCRRSALWRLHRCRGWCQQRPCLTSLGCQLLAQVPRYGRRQRSGRRRKRCRRGRTSPTTVHKGAL